MSLVTPSELIARVETHLSNATLQPLLDGIEKEIVDKIGAAYVDDSTPITEIHSGGGRHLYLKRRILSVETVTEYTDLTDQTGTALTEFTDFVSWATRGMLERVGNWGWRVNVSYVPTDDRKNWREAIIDLARIDIARMPMRSEGVQGEMNYTAPENWERERAKILQRLMFTEV